MQVGMVQGVVQGIERGLRTPLGMAVFGIVVLSILPNALMWLAGAGDGVWRIRNWTEFTAGTDSWVPIRDALAYVAAGDAAGLYEKTYYQTEAQFIYPPPSLLLFRALEIVGLADWTTFERTNLSIWFLIPLTGAMIGAIALRLAGRPGEDRLGAAALLAVAVFSTVIYYPIVKGYTLGQIQTLISALTVLALLCWTLGRRFLAGAAIALACVIKPQLSLVYVWSAFRKEWGFLAGGVAVAALFGTLSLLVYGLKVHLEYLDLISFLSRRGESYHASHTVNGLLNRMFFMGPNLEWDGTHTRLVYNRWIHLATTVTSLALILAAFFWRRPRAASASPIDLCLVLVALTLASPVAYEHHFGFTIAVFWICLVTMARPEMRDQGMLRPRHLAVLAVAYALCANFYFHPLDRLADTPFNFLQSYRLYGILALLWLLFEIRGRVAAGDRPC